MLKEALTVSQTSPWTSKTVFICPINAWRSPTAQESLLNRNKVFYHLGYLGWMVLREECDRGQRTESWEQPEIYTCRSTVSRKKCTWPIFSKFLQLFICAFNKHSAMNYFSFAFSFIHSINICWAWDRLHGLGHIIWGVEIASKRSQYIMDCLRSHRCLVQQQELYARAWVTLLTSCCVALQGWKML